MGTRRILSHPKSRQSVRCVLADRTRMDCQLLAASLQHTKGNCKVIGTASSAADAHRILRHQQADVVLVSPHLAEGPLAGFDLVQEIRDSLPVTRAVMLLDTMEPRMVVYSFEVGAKGVFSRDRSVEELSKCLAVVHQGQIWAGTSELQIILQAMAKRSPFEPVSATA